MSNLLRIELSDIEFHLFHGGWKIHHIVADEIFKAQAWAGYEITVNGDRKYSATIPEIITQHIEVVPGNPNDSHYWKILIDGKEAVVQKRFSTKGQTLLGELQRNEGLDTYEFHNKKFDLHSSNLKYFSGQIVHFREFKYHL